MKKKCILFILFMFIILQFYFFNRYVYAKVITQKRICGSTKYETCVQISNIGWKTSDYVVLVSDEDFSDVLCSSVLSKKLNNAPMLFTQKYVLDNSVKEQLQKLQVKTVYIIGGLGVISNDIEVTIEKLGIKVVRISGNDRYETSLKIAEEVEVGLNKQIIIASGENFRDAISIATIACQKNIPILLTKQNELPNSVKSYLANKNFSTFYIVGGTEVISSNIEKSLKNVKRIYGTNIYETNAAVLKEFYNSSPHNDIYIVSSKNYTDAIPCVVLASLNNSEILLTGNALDKSTSEYLSSKINTYTNIFVYGDTDAISNTVLNEILRYLGYYKIVNEKNYKMGTKIKITNTGASGVIELTTDIFLGKPSNSNHDKNGEFYIYGNYAKLGKDSDGNYYVHINIPYIAPGKTLQYDIGKKFTSGGIIYNTILSDSTGDYNGFNDYNRYTMSEKNVESDNNIIKEKAAEIVSGETNTYMKVKKIFQFVNTYVKYDSTQGNKGALNTLITSTGVCEDYADLMVAMLRSENIPARIVYGYYINDNEIALKGSDVSNFAHAWVEFYLPEYAWIFVDPSMNYAINQTKISEDNYFVNHEAGGYFVRKFNECESFYAHFNGVSNIDVSYIPYITVLPMSPPQN